MHKQSGRATRNTIIDDIVARTGIDEAMIERLVRTFYDRARHDPFIGPIFESRVHDWERHIARMCAFWSSVALMSGRYHGQPMAVHLPLPIDTAHFDRWLAMFTDAAREVCPPAAATHILERAHRIADSLELGIGNVGRGDMPADGHIGTDVLQVEEEVCGDGRCGDPPPEAARGGDPVKLATEKVGMLIQEMMKSSKVTN